MRSILKGSTDQSVVIRIVDSGDGTPETGVVFNTSGIDLWYRREGATKTSITEATLSALNDAHSDGGILHIGDGYYRLDLPDAAVATGANGVMVGGTVTGMVVMGCYVPLVDFDMAGQSAADLKDFADDGYDPSTNKVQGVVLVDTATTVTGGATAAGVTTAIDSILDAIRVSKNTQLANFPFLMRDSTDHVTPKTGLTITAQRSIDGAAFAACANSAAEVSAGVYKITLAAADLNGDTIMLKFTATGADAAYVSIVTQPAD